MYNKFLYIYILIFFYFVLLMHEAKSYFKNISLRQKDYIISIKKLGYNNIYIFTWLIDRPNKQQ